MGDGTSERKGAGSACLAEGFGELAGARSSRAAAATRLFGTRRTHASGIGGGMRPRRLARQCRTRDRASLLLGLLALPLWAAGWAAPLQVVLSAWRCAFCAIRGEEDNLRRSSRSSFMCRPADARSCEIRVGYGRSLDRSRTNCQLPGHHRRRTGDRCHLHRSSIVIPDICSSPASTGAEDRGHGLSVLEVHREWRRCRCRLEVAGELCQNKFLC
jgi:hypothetical protein